MAHSRRASSTHTRFQPERLEERALLSGLAYSLTTDEANYQPGQPIQISLTITNTSSQPMKAIDGPDLDHFVVTENGVQVWESESFILPIAGLVTLQPGQSVTDGDTWNGVPNEGPPTVLMGGSFTVTDQSVPNAGSANFTIDSPLSFSITTDKDTYSVGQPIQITYTQTDTSSQPVTANTAPSDFTITQEGQSAPVASLPGTWTTQSPTTTLQPGQSTSETASWNGVANVGSQYGSNVLGNLTVSDSAAPQPVTAGFQIANPIVTGFSATSSSFAAGDPVTLTYTATNSGDVPVTVLNSPASFSIQEELQIQDSEVFSQTGSGTGTLVTLQPGQSLTQSATWIPSGGQAPVGLYQAYCSGPFNGQSANFQVGATGSISTTLTTDKSDSAQYSDPTQDASTTFQIDSSNNPLPSTPAGVVASLATARSVVRLGQPMAFTLTLSNESNHTVDVSPKKKTGSVAIDYGSQVVWQSRKLTLRGHKTIAVGHSAKLRGVWSGNGSERVASRLAPGTYTIVVSYDGYSASQMIQIEG